MTSAKLKHAYAPWGDEVAADADCALDPGAPKARTDATAKIRGRIILVAKRLTRAAAESRRSLREDVRSMEGSGRSSTGVIGECAPHVDPAFVA